MQADIQSEVVLVYLRGENSSGRLRDAKFTTIGEEVFLTGTGLLLTPSHWAHGKRVHLPMRHVERVVEIGTMAEWQALEKEWARKRESQPPKASTAAKPGWLHRFFGKRA